MTSTTALSRAGSDGGHGRQETKEPKEPREASEETVRHRLQAFQILILLVATIAVFSAMQPDTFLTVFNFRGILQNTAIYAVLGVGMTFVIITGGIDLSVGSVLVFSGVVADKTMVAYGGQGWGTVLVGTLVACACGLGWGLLNGVLVAKAKVPPLVVTLGTMSAALGFAQIMTKGLDLRDAPKTLVGTIGFGNVVWQIPTLAVVAAVVVVLGIVLLHRTRFGLYTYTLGSNAEAGRRVGVRVDRQQIKIYAFAGLLAGFAGILNLAFYQSTTIGGQSNTPLNVIAGVAIGGTSLFGGVGSVFGTVVGLFIPIVLQNGFVQINVQAFWQQVVVGAVLVAVVYVDQLRRAAAQRGTRPAFPFLSARSRAGSGSSTRRNGQH
ncbi:ABC transporter permease [Streptomyces sp. NPDC047000]|uniref:ABC transporter permease n=1 Tax=Streptomyces sp. NPDC047000 TaxID=3155474 RepID=UPI0033C8578C